MREKVCVREVGLRDGLQMVATILPTERKIEWCFLAAKAGVTEIEVTSFVPAKVLPQFADAEEVVRAALAIGTIKPSALVPNLKGAERAFRLGLPQITYVLSASDAHNRANVRRSTEESISEFANIVEMRNQLPGLRPHLSVGISTSFGCTIAGSIPEERVINIASTLAQSGADEIIVADTVGYADPVQVRRLVSSVKSEVGAIPVGCHFHDTRGLGLANITVALDIGIRIFDASLGGLGGCPYAPGATGNVTTEDTVFLLERLGFDTGIDLQALIDLRKKVELWLPGENMSGAIARAGLPKI